MALQLLEKWMDFRVKVRKNLRAFFFKTRTTLYVVKMTVRLILLKSVYAKDGEAR